MIEKLPEKYLPLWQEASLLLKNARPGDYEHAEEIVDLILNYQGNLTLNWDILIPTAMMHDIGHAAILPEHFKYITGQDKIPNGKLVHMLAGAKIASDILKKVKYPEREAKEIVEIISVHDADSFDNSDSNKWYDTENKKLFHDLDSMDRFTEKRLESVKSRYPDKEKLLSVLQKSLNQMFFDEFKQEAEKRFRDLIK